MKHLYTIILIISLGFLTASAAPKEDEIDYLALASLMIQDGHYERAENALDQVDTSVNKFDFIYFYTLRGIVSMKLVHYDKAIKYFEQAITAGQQDKSLYLYIAQANYKLKRYRQTIQALDDAGPLGVSKPEYFSLRSDCYWKMDDKNSAIAMLENGYTRFPEYHDFIKQRFFYFIQLGLYQEAIDTANRYLNAAKPDAQTYVTLADALRKNNQFDQATTLLEKAKMLFPTNEKVILLLAHTYLDQGLIHPAASLFEEASYFAPEKVSEASEMYRRAKEFVHALYLNSQVLDEKEKLKQRLAIYLEFQEFARAVAMREPMERNGLLENEDIRYALAYAYFMNGEYDRAEADLKQLTRGDLFAKGIEIRKKIEQCRENRWECQ